MAALAKKINVGPAFIDKVEVVHAEWDFSVDGGATGALDIFEAGANILITHFHATVMTTATSGGSATLKVGITGDDDLFMTTTQGAVASLTANSAILPIPVLTEGTPNTIVMPLPVKLASGDKVLQTIGTAAMTAGKVKYTIGYVKL